MPTIQLKDGNGTLYYFNVSGDGSLENPFVPLSDLSVAGVPVAAAAPVPVTDKTSWLLRMMSRMFARFSFDPTSQLRVTAAGTVAISSGTVTTVTTVGTMTTGNISVGDNGKPATSILMSRQLTAPNYSRLTRV